MNIIGRQALGLFAECLEHSADTLGSSLWLIVVDTAWDPLQFHIQRGLLSDEQAVLFFLP